MKLVVGLGNPGKKYAGTRHNIGFEVVLAAAERLNVHQRREKFDGEWAEAVVSGERIGLLWPHTFMNLSGGAVLKARDFYKVEAEHLLVVCDDLSLPLGKLRFREQGSAGGQKGLDDILRRLGTQQIPRLRIGINPTPPGWDAADYVLARFPADERPVVDQVVSRAAVAVSDWIERGIKFCMNHYNGN